MTELDTRAPTIPQWNLADRLRKSLEHASIDAEAMASYLEVHPNTVRNWIAGRTHPRTSDVKLWAMRCGIPYEWLARGESQSVITAGGTVYEPLPDRPAGMSGQPEPGYAEVASPLDEFRKRLPLNPLTALLALAA